MAAVLSVGPLVRSALDDGPVKTRVDSLGTGLMVRSFEGELRKIWWCRFCHGKNPARAQAWVVYSIEDVRSGWEQHATSDAHAAEMSTRDRVAEIFRINP